MIETFNNRFHLFFSGLLALTLMYGCAGSKFGSARKGEQLDMRIREKKDVVNFSALKDQQTMSLAARGSKTRGVPLMPVVNNVVSLAANAIKNVIANEQKKYTASYGFALTDLYFYDQLSNESPFDPVGMQFSGFNIARVFINEKGVTDTAFAAKFSLDTSNLYEMLNNSIFRLRLEDLKLCFAKAKLPASGTQTLNMDIEIEFHASYANQDAVLSDNVSLGKFYVFLRNAPLDSTAKNYSDYYRKLKGSLLTGRSFIAPRSFGYHMEDGQPKPGFSQGAYTITVKVKESSKDNFIATFISENTSIMIDALKEKTTNYLDDKLPAGLH